MCAQRARAHTHRHVCTNTRARTRLAQASGASATEAKLGQPNTIERAINQHSMKYPEPRACF